MTKYAVKNLHEPPCYSLENYIHDESRKTTIDILQIKELKIQIRLHLAKQHMNSFYRKLTTKNLSNNSTSKTAIPCKPKPGP